MEPHSAVFDFIVSVPPSTEHSFFIRTRLCSTCAPLVTLLLIVGNEFRHINYLWGAVAIDRDKASVSHSSISPSSIFARFLFVGHLVSTAGTFYGGWFWGSSPRARLRAGHARGKHYPPRPSLLSEGLEGESCADMPQRQLPNLTQGSCL